MCGANGRGGKEGGLLGGRRGAGRRRRLSLEAPEASRARGSWNALRRLRGRSDATGGKAVAGRDPAGHGQAKEADATEARAGGATKDRGSQRAGKLDERGEAKVGKGLPPQAPAD